MAKRIVFHVGGPRFHPVDEQARTIEAWLGAGYRCELHDGVDAFEGLGGADLLVLMGLHWTGMGAEWAGRMAYRPMEEQHKEALARYVASGRPLLAHHGAIASYDDWAGFGGLVGFSWRWGLTTHSPVGDYAVRVLGTGHPVAAGVGDYAIRDELYYNVQVGAEVRPAVHAEVEWEGVMRPMVMTAEGGRVRGAGKVAYLANGHDAKAFECPAMKTLWLNAVGWLVG